MDVLELSRLSLAELQAGYDDLLINPLEVMEITFDQIERVNHELTALYDLRRDASFAAAKEAAGRFRGGLRTGPLDGVPVSIKDSVNASGMVWRHGSEIHGDGIVATVDSPPVAKLKAAGAIIFGKGTMPDFGLRVRLTTMGVSFFGSATRPWRCRSWLRRRRAFLRSLARGADAASSIRAFSRPPIDAAARQRRFRSA